MPQEAVIKQENEIQSYINSFKEMEEADEAAAGTSRKTTNESKIYITQEEEGSDQEVAVTEEGEGGDEEDYKYVFIVQDDEEMDEKGNAEGGDEEIYEFEDFGDEEMLEEIDVKSKVAKFSSSVTKKVTAGSQGGANHMCSFCNYTTNKRYLLARHMKVRPFYCINLHKLIFI